MPGYNPTFKPPPPGQQPGRSPSPPRRFVEPLSPARPRPIEPVFNYPALNNHINYAIRPEQPFAASPQSRNRNISYQNGEWPPSVTPRARNRSSTIEQLAEAALAASPRHHVHSSGSTGAYSYAPPIHSEPPHKRSRSEMLPSPLITQYVSRPATSYENSAWHTVPVQQTQHGEPVYDRRVEEAALLLNFRTGGWTTPKLPPPKFPGPINAQNIPRPHANSFPQDARQPRPVDLAAQAALLPPFNPQDGSQPRPTLPSPQQTIVDPHSSPRDDIQKHKLSHPFAMQDERSAAQLDFEMKDAPQQIQTPPDEDMLRAPSTDVTMSEASEVATSKVKRGSKSKMRATGGRKSIAEKATSRRAAARRKTPDASKVRKSVGVMATDDTFDLQELKQNRRKSVSDLVAAENDLETKRRAQSVPRDTPMIVRSVSPVKAPSRRKTKDHVDIICAGCATARETKHLNGELDEWISCNGCKNWFHVDCAGFKKAIEVRDVDKYFCSPCEPTHGKTTYVRKSSRAHASVDYAELQRGVLKTSEESNEHHYIQPIKDGTFQFDPESFPRMRPELVTRDIFERSSTFTEPICIPAAWNPRPWLHDHASAVEHDGHGGMAGDDRGDGLFGWRPDDYEYDTVPDDGQDKLGMVMPEELTVRQVCNLVGPDTPLDVIDVKTQNSGSKWTLGRWADYYEEAGDDKPIRNVISLEVSLTKLGRLLRRPKIVRDIDLQDDVWPQKEIDLGKWPKVQFYCLMSVADSYTDFHIDFGGSSVYYHILKGKKTFFFIPPKAKHLKAYEEWNDSPQQNYTFLPNITNECYRVDLSEGDTMLIPSGWIHAVWTPETSLVIGGNFLTRMSFQNQFKVVDIEKANETPMKFRYPFFQKIMWYTAIKYLKTDPLPDAVSQLFFDGKRFERQLPIWADFDGELAANDSRPGARNTRYYGQAELDGLPDLVTFIFHTVMLVMGRVEGITADRMKRVNASIPKGHGEPLEVAKTFALWVAWKRNEDPPAWAHPDAVLPNSKEGAPKKLSARALKDLERKEAIAAWRLAPDRQSARVKGNATATATASGSAHGPTPIETSTPDREHTHHQNHPSHHQTPPKHQAPQINAQSTMSTQAPSAVPMTNLMVGGLPHLSSPKTSVLGPKRVACDACRKRRIRCKHKDMVMQTSPSGANALHYMSSDAQYPGRDAHDNIVVKSATDVHERGLAPNGTLGQPMPGTNAYVNAHIPMAVNGVAIFDPSKRGRTKACYECRKSKRRCVHDEKGNVDPVKASETPVARGSGASKKRPLTLGENTPIRSKKAKSDSAGAETSPVPIFLQQQASPETHAQHLHTSTNDDMFQTQMGDTGDSILSSSHTYPQHNHLEQHETHAPLDPSLFAYQATTDDASYGASNYAYPTTDRPHLYQMQSLEQIASEVLDMNADYQDHNEPQLDSKDNVNATVSHDLPKDPADVDESVDSGVSLPGSESMEREGAQSQKDDAAAMTTEQSAALAAYRIPGHDDAEAAPSAGAEPSVGSTDHGAAQASQSGQVNSTSSLPLYRPPAPLPQSPEHSRRLANGVHHTSPAKSNGHRRKSSSMSQAPGVAAG